MLQEDTRQTSTRRRRQWSRQEHSGLPETEPPMPMDWVPETVCPTRSNGNQCTRRLMVTIHLSRERRMADMATTDIAMVTIKHTTATTAVRYRSVKARTAMLTAVNQTHLKDTAHTEGSTRTASEGPTIMSLDTEPAKDTTTRLAGRDRGRVAPHIAVSEMRGRLRTSPTIRNHYPVASKR